MKKIITLEKPHDFITIKIKGDKGDLYRRAAAGHLPAVIMYLCAYVKGWRLDDEILPVLQRMEPERWAGNNKTGFLYDAAA